MPKIDPADREATLAAGREQLAREAHAEPAAARVVDLPEGYAWAVVRNPWRRLLRFLMGVHVLLVLASLITFLVATGAIGDNRRIQWGLALPALGALGSNLLAMIAIGIVASCVAYYRREPAPLLASGKIDYARIGRSAAAHRGPGAVA